MMNEKPTIVIELCQFSEDRHNRDTPIPAHVRVVMHEPRKDNEADRCGPMGLLNSKADFRWFLPAGMGMPQFFSETFAFEPRACVRMQQLGNTSFTKPDADVDQYAVRLNPGSCNPRIDNFYLGEYEHEGVVHDVIGFCTHDLRTRVITRMRKQGCAYTLNTAITYADESFFDHLHLALTEHGFNTRYVKPGAQKFQAIKEYDFSETVDATYVCLLTGQQMTWRHEKHDPSYHYPEAFLLSATKCKHPFSLTDPKALENSMDNMRNWSVRSQIAKDFVWIENDAEQLNGL